MYRTHYSCHIMTKLESRKILIRFQEIPCNGSWLVTYGRTDGERDKDRHEEAKSRFSKFCERSKNGTFGNRVWGCYLASATTGSSEGRWAPLCYTNGPEFCDQLSDSPVVRRYLQQSATKLRSWTQYDCWGTHSSSLPIRPVVAVFCCLYHNCSLKKFL